MSSYKIRLNPRYLLILALLGGLVCLGLQSAKAQTAQGPDFSKFGFPNVAGSVSFTPGTATTLTAGSQKVQIPADFFSKPVKFELLVGPAAPFAPNLGDAQGSAIVTAFAFRVTDVASSQIITKFDKPVTWSITDPAIQANSAVYNTSATSPVKVTKNPSAGTVQGTTISHPFTGAGVGWLVLNPGSAQGGQPAAAPVAAPATGGGGSASANADMNVWFGLLASGVVLVTSMAGLLVRKRLKVRK